jgi:hypothetical protein
MLWSTFLLLGLSWHNQFFDVIGVLWLLLLYQLPAVFPGPTQEVMAGRVEYRAASLSPDRPRLN